MSSSMRKLDPYNSEADADKEKQPLLTFIGKATLSTPYQTH